LFRPVLFFKALKILWHIDLFLGNDRETNNETTAIARPQLIKYATVLEPLLGSDPRATMEELLEAVFSMVPIRGYVTRLTELSWLVSE
jgi:hypothetical protein